MSDNVVDLTIPPPPPILGPERGGCVVVHDKRIIPLLHGREHGDHVTIVVDNRFAATFDKQTAHQVVFLLAEAIAVASGYSHSGAKSKDGPFAPEMVDATGSIQ